MKHSFIVSLLIGSISVLLVQATQPEEYTNNSPHPVRDIGSSPIEGRPKNIILLIGDGMSLQHVTAAWTANKGKLYIEQCPVIGLTKPYSLSNLVTDSAAGGTALATGSKTLNGRIGMDEAKKHKKSLISHAQAAGKKTGVLTSSDITDATPAAFYAHNISRYNSFEIALELPNANIDFIFGGGLKQLTQRPDNKNLLKEMEQSGYSIILDEAQLFNDKSKKSICILAPSHLPLAKKRGELLSKATLHALQQLENPKGFFLMIESASIDKVSHDNKLREAIDETLDFDRVIGVTLTWAAKHQDTLVIIVSDHETGGLSLLSGNIAEAKVTASFSTGDHTGGFIPLYAYGPGSKMFSGIQENTALPQKIQTQLQP